MSPPLLGVGDEEGKQNVSLLTSSSASTENGCLKGTALKERNYMGLSDCSSSADSSVVSIVSAESKNNLNFKATELRLGLPGSLSPEREADLSLRSSTQLGEKPLFPLCPSNDDHYLASPKTAVLGSKRGFSDAMNGFPEGNFLVRPEVNVILSARPASNFVERKSSSVLENIKAQPTKATEGSPTKALHERVHISDETGGNQNGPANNTSNAPASKAQVVGWPPIGSFRKHSLATKTADEVDGKAGANALFVKVSMDGAPYLRKVDLTSYSGYPELSSALEKMFSCFTIALGRETLCESKLKDLLHGSEYVLTYEDKDGDWMLVGDVPWEMFIDTCKRMRIMKSSDAIGLAPRAVEKSKSRI